MGERENTEAAQALEAEGRERGGTWFC